MKIYLDRSVCNCWEAACTSDFSDKYLGKEAKPTACTLMVVDETKRDEIVFFIHDRDGQEKEFVVNDTNLLEAMDNWMDAYAQQQLGKEPITTN
jgi:hypothetical protein